MVKKVLRIYYAIIFLFSLSHSFFFATYVLFLTKAGLDLLEVNLINCTYMFSIFIFEVPTGVIADYYGRKKSFVLACFIYSFSMVAYFMSDNFHMFVVAEIFGALAASFYSGSFEAWMVDSIKEYEPLTDFEQIFRKGTIIGQIGIMPGTIIGAWVGENNLALPWLMSGVCMFMLGIVGIIIINEKSRNINTRKRKIGIGKFLAVFQNFFQDIFKIVKQSYELCVRDQAILFILLSGVIFNFACMAPNMYWQPVFKNLGMSVKELGFVFLGVIVMTMLGAHISQYAAKRIKKEKHAIVFILFIFALGLLIAVFDGTIFVTLSGYYIHELARGAFNPLKKKYINSRITSDYRATILSFNSMYGSLGSFIGLLVSGILAKNFSIASAWLASALILIVFLPYLYLKKNGE